MTAEIIDPTQHFHASTAVTPTDAARPETLAGLRIGLLGNTKRNADSILDAIGARLADRHAQIALIPRTKTQFAMPLPVELVEELIRDCDVVVIGVGDCGSCSASAVADAIALESVGIPTAVICTDAFVQPSSAMAGLKGAPDFPYLLTAHPIANLTADGVEERGEQLAAQVEARLIGSTRTVAAA
ncbi:MULTISPECIES: UGSC family (seleno)protein [unclassified Microbacterium]|uniref:UGSC family (seleno)protein n=1 Tax=unclassified Microbacterium TaxID=2609290 RepID=UPI00214AD3A1|nr:MULTISPECIES: UGSC family (seleno)protein [unclassified Microbacterium]MCR2811264.1 UGSC family (seleno)protein [Microbacterium sp. zg.B185]WIM19863.1 UGSC family (seleno)protein [Microbacterium sp. zg-B185]